MAKGDAREREKEIKQRFWDTLHHNGWSIVLNDETREDAYDTYTIAILVEYDVHCYARISTSKEGMHVDGHLGVLWIDAEDENGLPYGWDTLEEMQMGIIYAEENLLAVGVPFVPDYRFHGERTDEKEKRNKGIREDWMLDEAEAALSSDGRQRAVSR